MHTLTMVDTETGTRVGFGSAGIRMTPAEFDAIEDYDEEYRYELIHGVFIVTPMAAPEERGPNDTLGRWLLNYQEDHPQGAALNGTLFEQYVRTMDSRRRADRVIWAGLGRRPDPKEDTPTIVIEFVSPGKRSWRRDYIEKRKVYAEIGVREYWIIDRFQRTLTVYSTGPDGLTEMLVQEQDIYRSELLPGFELPMVKLLAVADQWTSEE